MVDIFHNDNFYGVHMKSKITTEKERIEDAEYAKLIKKHKKRAIYDHGEWTDEDEYNLERWF